MSKPSSISLAHAVLSTSLLLAAAFNVHAGEYEVRIPFNGVVAKGSDPATTNPSTPGPASLSLPAAFSIGTGYAGVNKTLVVPLSVGGDTGALEVYALRMENEELYFLTSESTCEGTLPAGSKCELRLTFNGSPDNYTTDYGLNVMFDYLDGEGVSHQGLIPVTANMLPTFTVTDQTFEAEAGKRFDFDLNGSLVRVVAGSGVKPADFSVSTSASYTDDRPGLVLTGTAPATPNDYHFQVHVNLGNHTETVNSVLRVK